VQPLGSWPFDVVDTALNVRIPITLVPALIPERTVVNKYCVPLETRLTLLVVTFCAIFVRPGRRLTFNVSVVIFEAESSSIFALVMAASSIFAVVIAASSIFALVIAASAIFALVIDPVTMEALLI